LGGLGEYNVVFCICSIYTNTDEDKVECNACYNGVLGESVRLHRAGTKDDGRTYNEYLEFGPPLSITKDKSRMPTRLR
jgi:hypothetical protein